MTAPYDHGYDDQAVTDAEIEDAMALTADVDRYLNEPAPYPAGLSFREIVDHLAPDNPRAQRIIDSANAR